MSSGTSFMQTKTPAGNSSMSVPVLASIYAINALYTHQVQPTFSELIYGGAPKYIQSMYAYPFDPSLGTADWNKYLVTPTAVIDVGSNGVADIPVTSERGYDLGYTFIPEIYGDFRDYEPFVKYSLYLPYFGEASLQSCDVKNKYIRIFLTVDFITGAGTYILALQSAKPTSTSGFLNPSTLSQVDRILAEYTFQLAAERPFVDTGFTDMKRNFIMSAAFLAASAARTIGNTTPNISNSNGGSQDYNTPEPNVPLLPSSTQALTAYNGGLPSTNVLYPLPLNENSQPQSYIRLPFGRITFPAFSTAVTALSNLQASPSGSTGTSILNMYSPTSAQLIIRRANFVDTIGKNFGRICAYPADYTTKIGDLKGYILINDVDLSNGFVTTTSQEKDSIYEILRGGVYIDYSFSTFSLEVNEQEYTFKFIQGQTWRQFMSTGMNDEEYQGSTTTGTRPVLSSNNYKVIAHFGDLLTDLKNGDFGYIKKAGTTGDIYTDAIITPNAHYEVTI